MPKLLDRKPLLEDVDQNIGNGATVNPQAGAFGTVIPQTTPGESVRLLNLRSDSQVGQTVSVVMTASRFLPNPNPGYPGPITGVLEFGNGSNSTRVEFDVPIGPYAGTIVTPTGAIQPQDGGVIVTVPTGVLRVYARYDNLLISPYLDVLPSPTPQSLAQLFAAPFYGPNAGGPSEPLQVKAMVSYFSQPRSRAYKTQYLYVAAPAAPVAINVNTRQYFALPAFTKKLKVLRTPVSSAIDIVLYNGISIVDQIAVAGGTTCPEIPIPGHVCVAGIQSPLPADSYRFLALTCELGI